MKSAVRQETLFDQLVNLVQQLQGSWYAFYNLDKLWHTELFLITIIIVDLISVAIAIDCFKCITKEAMLISHLSKCNVFKTGVMIEFSNLIQQCALNLLLTEKA